MLRASSVPPPSSNRTCRFPASGSPVSTRRCSTQSTTHNDTNPRCWKCASLRLSFSLSEETLSGSPLPSARFSVVGFASKRVSPPLTETLLQ